MQSLSRLFTVIKSTLPGDQALLLAIFAFLAPIKFQIWGIIALVIIDAMTAITLAVKSKLPVESKKLRKTIGKLGIYLTVIVSAYIAETAVGGPELTAGIMVKSLTFLIAGAECKSLMENCSGLMQSTDRLNFWQVLLSNLQSKVASGNSQGLQDTVQQAATETVKEILQPKPPTQPPPSIELPPRI